jgi:hypothetical protein
MKTAGHKEIKINAVILRHIAQALAQRHHLDFDLVRTNAIYGWLADKWSELETEFFAMLDNFKPAMDRLTKEELERKLTDYPSKKTN